jgi:hypothetical protein
VPQSPHVPSRLEMKTLISGGAGTRLGVARWTARSTRLEACPTFGFTTKARDRSRLPNDTGVKLRALEGARSATVGARQLERRVGQRHPSRERLRLED